MPGRLRFACLIVTTALLLAACGKASIDSTTPYFLDYDAGDTKTYTLTAEITEVKDGVINGSTQPVVIINGIAQAMSGNTFGPQAYVHTEPGNTGLNVHFEAEYQINYLLGPATRRTRDPDAGTLMIPIVGAGFRRLGNVRSDLDGDGIIDRYDNCPFHPNAEQQNASGNRFGNACDSAPDPARLVLFDFGCGNDSQGRPVTPCEHFIVGQDIADGSVILENENGDPVWSIRSLRSANGRVTGVSGVSAIDANETDDLSVEFANCSLLYQDDDDGHAETGMQRRFLQIYGGEVCTMSLRRGNTAIARGDDPLIMVVIINSPGAAAFGNAWGWGRVTLRPLDDPDPLFEELTEGSPANYLHFVIRNFDPVGRLSASSTFDEDQLGPFDAGNEAHKFYAVGRFAAAGAFVVRP